VQCQHPEDPAERKEHDRSNRPMIVLEVSRHIIDEHRDEYEEPTRTASPTTTRSATLGRNQQKAMSASMGTPQRAAIAAPSTPPGSVIATATTMSVAKAVNAKRNPTTMRTGAEASTELMR
jgi:hypothetical protein